MLGYLVETIFSMVDGVRRLKDDINALLVLDDGRASAILRLPGADQCPLAVQLQMIVDYIKRVNNDQLKDQKKKIESVLDRLTKLKVSLRKADTVLKYEKKELEKIQKYLALLKMDTKSVKTQTLRSIKPVWTKSTDDDKYARPIPNISLRIARFA